jgi:hypothetical protein
MKKKFLEQCLADGLSLDEIGTLVDRCPTTVSYHLKKHGLTPVGQRKHRPVGHIDEAELKRMADEGATLRAMADRFRVGTTAIRTRLRRLGLETAWTKRLRITRPARDSGITRLRLTCVSHGETWFFLRRDGGWRCNKCSGDAVARWRRRVKARLVKRAGGACAICGYDRWVGALHFHHLDPSAKLFALSRRGHTRAFAEAEAEAEKCVLLCANCHSEVEAGISELPLEALTVKLPPQDSSARRKAA